MSLRKHLISFSALIMYWAAASGQTPLNRTIPVEVRGQRLEQVLDILSNRGNFYFSYNSNIIPRDSLVTLSASNKTVGQVLAQLLPGPYEFRESGNYIIIRRAPIRMTVVTRKVGTEDRTYTVSGYVLDEQNGYQLPHVSIYEKRQLASALTNSEGYFSLRLMSRPQT